MSAKRLAALTGLAVLGALCAGTAASVYTASIPSRELHASFGARADRLGADPADPGLHHLAPMEAAERLTFGACLQIREMLFGATAERWQALDSLSARIGADSARARATLASFDTGSLGGRVRQCRAHK